MNIREKCVEAASKAIRDAIWDTENDLGEVALDAVLTVLGEPGAELLGEGIEQWNQHDDCEQDVLGIWRAMLEVVKGERLS